MVGYLEISDGRTVDVRDGLTIGRVSACDIELDDGKVSRKHARLIVEGGVVEVEDLRSSNGTQLNGKPVERRMVRDGDVIRVGRTELVFHERAEPEPPIVESATAAAPTREPEPEPEPAATEDLLAGDLLAGDLLDDDEFVDVPIAPPQLEIPPAPPPRPAPPRVPTAAKPASPEPAVPKPAVPKPAVPKPAVPKPAAPKPAAPRPAAPKPASPRPAAAAAPQVEAEPGKRDHGVLQFSKRGHGGALFDDVGQTGGTRRLMIVLAGIVLAIAVGFAVMQLVAG